MKKEECLCDWDTERVSIEEVVEMMVQFHDLALMLLSMKKKVSPRLIHDQQEYIKLMVELFKENCYDFSLENVAAAFPENQWYGAYMRLTPELDAYMKNEQTQGSFFA